MPIKLLVVEDHQALLDVTVETLTTQGHEVIGIDSAEAMDELPDRFTPDIAILDINLPGEDGLSLARRLRNLQPDIGIIMLTARRALEEKLAGYEHGADVYLTKPIAPEELCAAVQALALRLARSVPTSGGTFSLNLAAELLHTPLGDVPLRGSEASLLHALALAPDNTLATWQALAKLKKPMSDQGKAQLEVLVSRLRGKLIAQGAPSMPIRALRGIGYRLSMPLKIR
ncbi:MAG: response regulator [Devosia sp.]